MISTEFGNTFDISHGWCLKKHWARTLSSFLLQRYLNKLCTALCPPLGVFDTYSQITSTPSYMAGNESAPTGTYTVVLSSLSVSKQTFHGVMSASRNYRYLIWNRNCFALWLVPRNLSLEILSSLSPATSPNHLHDFCMSPSTRWFCDMN